MRRYRTTTDLMVDILLIAFLAGGLFCLSDLIWSSITQSFADLRTTLSEAIQFGNQKANLLELGMEHETAGRTWLYWLSVVYAIIALFGTMYHLSPIGRWPSIGEFMFTCVAWTFFAGIALVSAMRSSREVTVRYTITPVYDADLRGLLIFAGLLLGPIFG